MFYGQCFYSYTFQGPPGNIKIDKAKSTEKVDGPVAMVMAYAQIMVEDKPTIYTSGERQQGLLML